MNLVSQHQESAGADVVIPLEGGAAYRIGARLGRTGDVHEARHPRVDGRVALKLFRRATGLGATALEAFYRDSAGAGRLRHPHIAQVIESGMMPDGTPFTAQEYLDGQTLKERMVGRGAFLPTEVLPAVRGIAAALTAAHCVGLFHRALCPDNVFVANLAGYEQGFVKVLDFGACHLMAAQIADGHNPADRATRYFAPEQMHGHSTEADGRADQFALAAIARRMLNGTSPANAPSASPKRKKKDRRPSQKMAVARHAPAVDAVISRAMSNSPADRFESVSAFLRAFEEGMVAEGLVAAAAPSPTLVPASASAPAPLLDRNVPVSPLPTQLASESRIMNTALPPLVDAPVVRPGVDPSSLSTKFFAEGDLQEATNFKNLVLVPEPKGRRSSPHLQFDSFDQIPTRRRPMVLVLLATLFAIAGVAWLTGARRSGAWQKMEPAPEVAPEPSSIGAPSSRPEQMQAPAADEAVVTAPPPAVDPAPESSPTNSASVTESATVTGSPSSQAVTEVLPVPAPRVAAPARVKRVAPVAARLVRAPASASPSSEPAPGAPIPTTPGAAASEDEVVAEPAPTTVTADNGTDAKAAVDKAAADRKRARPVAPKTDIVRRRPGPLYLWSPEKQVMVPAAEITGATP